MNVAREINMKLVEERINEKGNSQTTHVLRLRHLDHKVLLPTNKGKLFMRLRDISHFKSEEAYCFLFSASGDRFLVLKSLRWVEGQLDRFGFVRPHQSFIVNASAIRLWKMKDQCLLMDCGSHIPISRRRKARLCRVLS